MRRTFAAVSCSRSTWSVLSLCIDRISQSFRHLGRGRSLQPSLAKESPETGGVSLASAAHQATSRRKAAGAYPLPRIRTLGEERRDRDMKGIPLKSVG